ncbi:MAG: DpnD/PcfM family protein [Lachnospiraceae bacterium]|nr:DpnD/PcfM family protein [Lachnospiraceae bacterium]
MKKLQKEAEAMKKHKSKTEERERSGRAFKVTVTETLQREITVYESELKEPTLDDAEQTVRDWWSNGDIILVAEDFKGVEFQAKEGGGQDGE